MKRAFSAKLLWIVAALMMTAFCVPVVAESAESERVMTVRGWIEPEKLGVTLPHEHLLLDFIGADQVSRDRYDPDEVFDAVLPHLTRAKGLGVSTLVESSPAYLGRDPALMRRLSEAADVHILTNTGYYGARGHKFLPPHAFEETAEQLAARWTNEWENGIEDTGIRPGFMKIAVVSGSLSDIHKKLVRAAAKTHLSTGLTIACHADDGIAAAEALDILEQEGVNGSAFIWIHANQEPDKNKRARVAERGAWVSMDAVTAAAVPQYVEMVTDLRERGHLDRVLLSHDAGWYTVGEPGGGTFRPFEDLFIDLIPALREAGFTEEEINQVNVENPREAFIVRVRAVSAQDVASTTTVSGSEKQFTPTSGSIPAWMKNCWTGCTAQAKLSNSSKRSTK